MAAPAPEAPTSPHTNLAHFLLAAAAECPHEVCLETEGACYTFAQVARMADAVRLVLREALARIADSQPRAAAEGEDDAAPEDPVPFHTRRPDEHIVTIVLDRGAECLAAVHAVMLERCVYNTFDTTEPRDKLRCWVEIAHPPIMICSRQVMARLGLSERGWSLGPHPNLVLDVHEAIIRGEGRAKVLPPSRDEADLERLCYVIFTSGSTGKPKAVMIQHRSACNLVRVWSDFIGLGRVDRFAQMASMAFDNHVVEVYGTLDKRCTSVVVPDVTKRSGPDLLQWLADRCVTGACVVPSLLRSMAGAGTDVSRTALPLLRLLDCGGEALGQDVVDVWAPGRQLFNIYGPTEVTVVCAGCEVRPGDEITIGWDLPTYRNLVLDPETLQPLPAGQRGALFTFGVGLARGYLDDEAKTSGKFVQVPGLGRAYSTGDVASIDTHGRIHYHGRSDWQVKVRGVRIELEALEEAVGNVPGVKHCEARVVDEGRKLALIASGEAVDEAAVKEAAATLGSGYRLNVVKICENTAWKFNTSGKLVRNHVSLEAGGDKGQGEGSRTSWDAFDKAGADELELEVAACAAQLVWAEAWNRGSHFIEELGIDSAGFGKLITLLRRRPCLASVDLPMLFAHPTVEALARRVRELGREQAEDAAEGEDYEDLTLDSAPGSKAEELLDLFLASVRSRPHSPCLEVGCSSVTYSQTFRMALCLQVALRKELVAVNKRQHKAPQETQHGLEPGERIVAIALAPGPQFFASLIAILLERCAVCILDPSLAPTEVAERLALVQPVAILTSAPMATTFLLEEARLCLQTPCGLVDAAAAAQVTIKQPVMRRPRKALTGRGLCWVGFTTGPGNDRTLATLVDNSAAVWVVECWQRRLQLQPTDRCARLLAVTDPGFLASVAAIAAGCTLLSPPESLRPSTLRPGGTGPRKKPDGTQLLRWLQAARPTVLGCLPSQLQALEVQSQRLQQQVDSPSASHQLPDLRVLWVVGEPCSCVLAARWSAPGRRFLSLFCTTETLACSALELEAGEQPHLGRALSSGRPLNGAEHYILDEQTLKPLPRGSAGSLFIGGPGLARGYLGDELQTSLRFVEVEGLGRLFQTGELARETIKGLELLGGSQRRTAKHRATRGFGSHVSHAELPTLLGRAGGGAAEQKDSKKILAREMPGGARELGFRTQPSIESNFASYILQVPGAEGPEESYDADARPMLCLMVQSVVLVARPVLAAIKPLVTYRLLLPYMLMDVSLLMMLGLVLALLLASSLLKLTVLVACKWLLIGRYREGNYPIYGSFYLRHWLVEMLASGTAAGKDDGAAAGWHFDIGRNFRRNLCLRALGADVSLSAMVTARVCGYDCIRVGSLASVHGPHHLTAVSFQGKRMIVGRHDIGDGAHVGQASCVAAGARILAGAYVEPLSAVPAGAVVSGRWTGVPARQVEDANKERVPAAGAGFPLAMYGAATSGLSWALGTLPGTVVPVVSVLLLRAVLRWMEDFGDQVAEDMIGDQPGGPLDELPSTLTEHLWLIPATAAIGAVANVLFQLGLTIIACRVLPRTRVPMDLPLHSVRAQLAALKIRMAARASEALGDASVQAFFLRCCGARVGRGSSMSEQIMLPETVEVGKGCFFASGNTLTSMIVDQGRLRIPTRTVVGDGAFLGNTNHISEGLPADGFAGLHTWLPSCPKPESGDALFFGNPAMRFARPAAGEAGHAVGSRCQVCWYHFSTSVVDVLFWPVLKSQEGALAFVLGRLLFPTLATGWQAVAETLCFASITMLVWYLMHIRFSNWIYNDRAPLQNRFYSPVVMRWFSANKIRKVFTSPFRTAGTMWQAPFMRAIGVQVGARFFSPNEDVMIDPPFARVGDDVTVDYDAQVRQHSFEDMTLKWGPNWVGSGATILQAGCLAMCDAGEGSVLRRGSVTWKDMMLEPGQEYDGAPAVAVDGADLV